MPHRIGHGLELLRCEEQKPETHEPHGEEDSQEIGAPDSDPADERRPLATDPHPDIGSNPHADGVGSSGCLDTGGGGGARAGRRVSH